MSRKREREFFVIDEKSERILRAVHFYRYMTAIDVAHLFYSLRGIRQAREALSGLCGGGDNVGGQCLYRFRMPSVEAGSPERIYTLGARGREFLSEATGIPIKWRMDKQLGFSQVLHNLLLTRFMVAGRVFCGERPDWELMEERICYEFPERGALSAGQGRVMSVVPDGWLCFSRQMGAGERQLYPVLVEADRGTMFRERFVKHIRSRVSFVADGEYESVFGTPAVIVAYVATGTDGKASSRRLESLCSWAGEALSGHEGWERVFRFSMVDVGGVYEAGLFDRNCWYRIDRARPVGLFEG